MLIKHLNVNSIFDVITYLKFWHFKHLENFISDFTLAEYVKMQKSCSYERESIKGQREDIFFIKFNWK